MDAADTASMELPETEGLDEVLHGLYYLIDERRRGVYMVLREMMEMVTGVNMVSNATFHMGKSIISEQLKMGTLDITADPCKAMACAAILAQEHAVKTGAIKHYQRPD